MNVEPTPSSERLTDGKAPEGQVVSTPENSSFPDRREFLATVAKESITAVGTLHAMIGPALYFSESLLKGPTLAPPAANPYSFTNEWTEVRPGLGFHNIGVRHTAERFLEDRELLIAAIKKHDVVLLEGCRGQEYFDFVAALAHHEGKKVVRLESDISPVASTMAITVVPIASAIIACRNMSYYIKKGVAASLRLLIARTLGSSEVSNQDTNLDVSREDDSHESHTATSSRASLESRLAQFDQELTWRQALLTLVSSCGLEVFGVSRSVLSIRRNPKSFHHTDWSYIVDGRTVIMLSEIERFLEKNQGVSAMCISGNAHATGFSMYMSSPENRALYSRKLASYERVYKTVFGGNARVEVDPARK